MPESRAVTVTVVALADSATLDGDTERTILPLSETVFVVWVCVGVSSSSVMVSVWSAGSAAP